MRRKHSTLARAVSIACGLCLSVVPASAPRAAASPAPDFSLAVSPTRMVVSADELGKPQYFDVTDRGRLPLEVSVSKRAFVQLPDGAPQFEADEPYSAVTWVTLTPEQFLLLPGQHQTVAVHIAPPADPEPGEHQVALISSVAAPTEGADLRLTRSVGVALYISLPGDRDDSTNVTGLQAPSFAIGGPIDFTTTVHSVGTMHRDFTGTNHLNVSVDGAKVPVPDFVVLRDATRVVSAQWQNPPMFCICHATVSIADSGGRISEGTATVVIFPVQWLAPVLVLMLLVIVFFVRRRARAKRSRQG